MVCHVPQYSKHLHCCHRVAVVFIYFWISLNPNTCWPPLCVCREWRWCPDPTLMTAVPPGLALAWSMFLKGPSWISLWTTSLIPWSTTFLSATSLRWDATCRLDVANQEKLKSCGMYCQSGRLCFTLLWCISTAAWPMGGGSDDSNEAWTNYSWQPLRQHGARRRQPNDLPSSQLAVSGPLP